MLLKDSVLSCDTVAVTVWTFFGRHFQSNGTADKDGYVKENCWRSGLIDQFVMDTATF